MKKIVITSLMCLKAQVDESRCREHMTTTPPQLFKYLCFKKLLSFLITNSGISI